MCLVKIGGLSPHRASAASSASPQKWKVLKPFFFTFHTDQLSYVKNVLDPQPPAAPKEKEKHSRAHPKAPPGGDAAAAARPAGAAHCTHVQVVAAPGR